MRSVVKDLGPITLPEFSGVRVQMMPFRLEDVGTLPDALSHWRRVVAHVVRKSDGYRGTGYLTIDEAFVRAGETHRRPGLHIDGTGGHGPGPGPWAGSGGMYCATSVTGSRAWVQDIDGDAGEDGDCKHLRNQLRADACVDLSAGRLWWMSQHAVHESLPLPKDTRRQFLRVSMPSENAGWHRGYTENPNVRAPGPLLDARPIQMAFRP